MSDFRDPDLERLLGGASGAYPDVNDALVHVRGRVRQVKRRRVVVATTAACAALVLTVGVAALRTDRSSRLVPPAGRGSADLSVEDLSDRSTSSTALPATSVAGTATTTATPSTPATATPTTQPGTQSTGGSTATTTGSTGAPATNPPATAPADVVRTFSGTGGSITVRLRNGSLTLTSSTPAAGFSIESGSKTAGDRVEVSFTDGNHRTRIRVDLKNGTMEPRIDES